MPFFAKSLFSLILVTAALLLSGCGSSKPEPEVAEEPIIPLGAPGTKIIVTEEHFNQLQNDMTYAQVERLIGHPGKSAKGTVLDLAGTVYVWRNTNGSNLVCLFQDNKLINKTNTSLPSQADIAKHSSASQTPTQAPPPAPPPPAP